MKLRLIFRFLAEYAMSLIWFINLDGKIIYANKTALDYLGVTVEQLGSQPWGWMPYIHPDDLEDAKETFKDLMNLKGHYEALARIRRHDGEYRWFKTTGGPVLGLNGECLGFVGSTIDIHDLKVTEDKLVKYAERLEESNKELEHFASIASHDLQEPLRKLLLFSDHLRRVEQDRLSLEGMEDLERIQRAVTRMQRLVNDLLDLSRVTRRRQPLQKVELNQIAREVITELSYAYPDIYDRVTLQGEMAIDAIASQMHQLLSQLLDNALKFHAPDQPSHVQINIAAENGNQCRITVMDDGIGILPEHFDKIFNAFVRLHSGTEYSGTGIGLALARKIVERHRGTLTVESILGQGSTFTGFLPIHQSSLEENDWGL
ncbi:MAG TPA: ATP-binding protein [Oculatellaceae cyanobacterium]|jgi:PAS domain S-box-containing protein